MIRGSGFSLNLIKFYTHTHTHHTPASRLYARPCKLVLLEYPQKWCENNFLALSNNWYSKRCTYKLKNVQYGNEYITIVWISLICTISPRVYSILCFRFYFAVSSTVHETYRLNVWHVLKIVIIIQDTQFIEGERRDNSRVNFCA